MASPRQNWLNSLGAYACLVAVLLIYAPQGMIAWWAGTGACCKSDYCPIPEHHRTKPTSPAEHAGMECEHGASAAKAGMAACGMSCCHDSERALMAPVVFVLAPATQPQGLASVARVAESPAAKDFAQSSKPLSPPPRIPVAA